MDRIGVFICWLIAGFLAVWMLIFGKNERGR
jgi:hypothetical protein